MVVDKVQLKWKTIIMLHFNIIRMINKLILHISSPDEK